MIDLCIDMHLKLIELLYIMENNLYKEGIHIVSMNDNNFYKNTRNNVLIIPEKLYLLLHNNLYFFRNRLTIVLTIHPNIFLDDKVEDDTINNNFKNEKTDIIFTNNEKSADRTTSILRSIEYT